MTCFSPPVAIKTGLVCSARRTRHVVDSLVVFYYLSNFANNIICMMYSSVHCCCIFALAGGVLYCHVSVSGVAGAADSRCDLAGSHGWNPILRHTAVGEAAVAQSEYTFIV